MVEKEELTRSRIADLFPELELIKDEQLKEAVVGVWNELWQQSDFTDLLEVPVSLKIDYPQLKHTQAVARMAVSLAGIVAAIHGTEIDLDVLIAGALLMDVSKLVEYKPADSAKYARTAVGALLPHGTISASLLLGKRVPMEVVHIVLAHSPNGGKEPQTVEAQMLDRLDQLDLNAFGVNPWKRTVMHFQS
ncbi:MAG: HD domain-containing protein [Cryobacterium sp.]|nr:HD domain-containing protein [Cryobacterium sp.]